MRAKAAGSLCAACLTKSKEKSHTHCQNASGTLTDGKSAGGVLCAKNKGVCGNAGCAARGKRAPVRGAAMQTGKDVEQEKRTSHSGSAGTLRKSRVGERKTKRKTR